MVAKSNNLIIEDLKKAKDMASRLVNNKKVYFLDDDNLIKLPVGYESTYLLKDNTLWITNKEKSENENLEGFKINKKKYTTWSRVQKRGTFTRVNRFC